MGFVAANRILSCPSAGPRRRLLMRARAMERPLFSSQVVAEQDEFPAKQMVLEGALNSIVRNVRDEGNQLRGKRSVC